MILERDEDYFPRAIQLPKEFDDDLDDENPRAVDGPPLRPFECDGMETNTDPVLMPPLTEAEEPVSKDVPVDLISDGHPDEPVTLWKSSKKLDEKVSNNWLQTMINSGDLRRPWDGPDLTPEVKS